MAGCYSLPAASGRSPTDFCQLFSAFILTAIGLTTTAIGWIFTAALAGGAVMTIVITDGGRQVWAKNIADSGRRA